MTNRSYLTAITRGGKPSLPMRRLDAAGLLTGRMLDYGCGRGIDADIWRMQKYDPYYFPALPRGKFDTITCNYVLNVIESRLERQAVLDRIKQLSRGQIYITVRNDTRALTGTTRRGTWQGHIILDCPIIFRESSFITYRLPRR